MPWFPRRGGDRKGSEGEPAPEPELARLHTLALGDLLSGLVPGGAYRFLDLGPAVGSNIEYLSRFTLSVQVADLWGSLANGEPRSWERALEALAPEAGSAGYHAVLAWDLLNYLSPDRLRQLAARLAETTRPGGLVFALVYYSREMPAEPLRFRIADRETLTYPAPGALRPAPRYPQRTIQQAFADFETEKAYVLKTGQHELLLARRMPFQPGQAEGEDEEG